MHQSIEQEIIRGEAIALHIDQVSLIQAAFDAGLKVYANPEGAKVKFDWFDKAAGIANRLKIAELREALAK